MIRGSYRFARGLLRLPLAVQLWLAVLGVLNLALPLMFLVRYARGDRTEFVSGL